MKKLLLLVLPFLVYSSCKKDDFTGIDFRQEMRDFVIGISDYSHTLDTNFVIIPQNGQEIITDNGEATGTPKFDYLQAIDATGREDLFYGYNADNKPTPQEVTDNLLGLLQICEQNGVEVLTTDYCTSTEYVDDSYSKNNSHGFISTATERALDLIPSYPAKPYNENDNDILTMADAKNFLYLINPDKYTSKAEFISDLQQTNFDVIIMDLFFEDGSQLTNSEISSLKTKANGGKRLVICYMSIGEAEDYRYYWQSEWKKNPPDWLYDENPQWKGNYKVKYWMKDWQDIIYGNDSSYLKKIIDAGYDGVYLDIIDAFEYFENL